MTGTTTRSKVKKNNPMIHMLLMKTWIRTMEQLRIAKQRVIRNWAQKRRKLTTGLMRMMKDRTKDCKVLELLAIPWQTMPVTKLWFRKIQKGIQFTARNTLTHSGGNSSRALMSSLDAWRKANLSLRINVKAKDFGIITMRHGAIPMAINNPCLVLKRSRVWRPSPYCKVWTWIRRNLKMISWT